MQVFTGRKFPLEFGTLFTSTSLGNWKSKYHRQFDSVNIRRTK